MGTGRTTASLKLKWEMLKKTARKEFTEDKKSVKQTGGGPSSAAISCTSNRIVSIIGVSAVGCSSRFDSDAANAQILLEKEQPGEQSNEHDLNESIFVLFPENIEGAVENIEDNIQINIEPEIVREPAALPLIERTATAKPFTKKAQAYQTKPNKKYEELVTLKIELIKLQKEILKTEHESKIGKENELHMVKMKYVEEELKKETAESKLAELKLKAFTSC